MAHLFVEQNVLQLTTMALLYCTGFYFLGLLLGVNCNMFYSYIRRKFLLESGTVFTVHASIVVPLVKLHLRLMMIVNTHLRHWSLAVCVRRNVTTFSSDFLLAAFLCNE